MQVLTITTVDGNPKVHFANKYGENIVEQLKAEMASPGVTTVESYDVVFESPEPDSQGALLISNEIPANTPIYVVLRDVNPMAIASVASRIITRNFQSALVDG